MELLEAYSALKMVIYITREIKPLLFCPCVPVEKNYAGEEFLQVEAAKFWNAFTLPFMSFEICKFC
jgi:hypothetical protein